MSTSRCRLTGCLDRRRSHGKLHVAITSPLRSTDLLAHMPLDVPLTLSAASNANGSNSVTYAWSVFNRDNVVTLLGPQIVGQSVSYTPTGPGMRRRREATLPSSWR